MDQVNLVGCGQVVEKCPRAVNEELNISVNS